ncbi:cell division protein FtsQ/DivIB [Gordonia liuliyuniae]|uniref:FtsQ-type POTRA domain-containing protein n=1 Tax=Gordonia liuliyuniae TaxID=2911517 RepID=A0ABS9IUV3_9ACTN|nr:FtsQ-type POTRA domain-containing protein [Gordonia liuliyuniae]MCF8589285.1 FtsQ-type POTRA domain-containing protein [Gordonia liuliyuniae]
MSSRRGRGENGRRPSRATVIVALVLALIVVGSAVAVAYLTPLMSVRNVDVVGAKVVDETEILRVAQAPTGTPLLQVDTGAIASRIAVLPAIEEVTVEREYPSTLAIDVTERVPVAIVDQDGKVAVMDRLGVTYQSFPDRKSLPSTFAGLPTLVTDHPGPKDPTTTAVLKVAQALPQWLHDRTASIEASSPVDITLVLDSERRAVWGDSSQNDEKAESLRQILRLKGDEFNVSSPDYPAVK